MQLARLLLVRFRWFDDALRTRLVSAGFPELTTAQSMVFPFLDKAGTRPAELARRLGVTRQSAHSLIHGLVRLGLVELVDDPSDGRSKLVILTSRGRRSVAAAQGIFEDLEQALADRIGARRLDQLGRGLQADWGDHAER